MSQGSKDSCHPESGHPYYKEGSANFPRNNRVLPSQYAALAAPLSDLTRKSSPTKVVWSKQCSDTLEELKKQLCEHASSITRTRLYKTIHPTDRCFRQGSWGGPKSAGPRRK